MEMNESKRQTRQSFSFSIGQLAPDRWVAASSVSPYFCFVGASVDEVRNKAHRALNFYHGVEGALEKISISTKPAITVERVSHRKRERFTVSSEAAE